MSLHYFVKLKMLIVHVGYYSWVVKERYSRFYLILIVAVAFKFTKFECSWSQHMGILLKKCTKHSPRTETARNGPSWITSSLQQPFVSGIVNGSRSVMHALYTFSCSIPHTLQSNGVISGERIWRPVASLGEADRARGYTRMKFLKMWLNLERTVDKRGRTAEKITTLQTAMTKKGRHFFRKK